ncbi:DUF488 family protein [Oceaniovalibus sp. ACAM 378]|uniref:DUF488 domain-containing protein n=1 Tax=Oceaniovalibus sp. ACAM 378 TaxID=2599923 RepID=UPI0011DA9C47|nr:DUF488 domain-containing protein [Oceaniovalibus sp. ACAM 378]TYB91218.1 DUF488 domain-containing protein [Oceaniovalibus sp. ACAM 378]
MATGFRTVGHSNRSLAEFVDILQRARVQTVCDVRSFPRSRTNPWFNIDSLPKELERYQIGYRHFPDLGGRRNIQHDIPDDVNAFWRNRSFHNYADYAMSEQFAQAYRALVELGEQQIIAMMCSEAVWWRCHRRIITDYLILNGYDVIHLMGNGREDPAKPTPGADRIAAGKVIYPAAAGA